MAADTVIFLALAILVVLIWAFVTYQVMQLKKQLAGRDNLIEIMMLCLPKLLGKDSREMDLQIQTTVSRDSDYIKVRFECTDDDFVCKLYNYLGCLQRRGIKATVDYINGSTRFGSTK